MKGKRVNTNLICPDCGNVFPIQRKIFKQKKNFHLKKMYCPMCCETKNHIEIKDIGLFIADYEFSKEEKTEEERKVYSLIKKR